MTLEQTITQAVREGIVEAFKELHGKGIIEGDLEPKYDLQDVLNLHRVDKRFKPVTKATLRNWENENLLHNIGTPKNNEKELLHAMNLKGRKRATLPSVS
jgi:hypothetical protein